MTRESNVSERLGEPFYVFGNKLGAADVVVFLLFRISVLGPGEGHLVMKLCRENIRLRRGTEESSATVARLAESDA